MEKQNNVVPIQKIAKFFGIISIIGSFSGLAYFFTIEQYVAAFTSFFTGLALFSGLMTLAKIADDLDELKKIVNKDK